MPRRRVNRTERLASQVRRRQRNTEFIRQRRASSVPHNEGSTRNDVEERTASSQLLLLDDAVGADRSPEREQTGNGVEPMQWARADNQPTSQQNLRYAHNQDDERRLRAAERMRIRRADNEHVRSERAVNRAAMRIRRQHNMEYRRRERGGNSAAMQNRRNRNPHYRVRERQMNRFAMQLRRNTEPLYRNRERIVNSAAMRVRRIVNSLYRQRERRANHEAMRTRREQDGAYNENQRLRNRISMHVRRAEDVQGRNVERAANSEAMRRRRESDHVYRGQERAANALAMAARRRNMEVRNGERIRDRASHQQQRNNYAAALVAYEAAIKEGPTYVCNCCGRLQFKRSITHLSQSELREARSGNEAGNYISGNVRPNRVWEAALHLTQQPLYQEHNIDISNNWLIQYNGNEPRIADPNIEIEEDEEAEDAEPVNPGVQETMLLGEESGVGIRMAPGEGQRPISILLDEDTEYLSFPAVFGGKKLHPHYAGRPMSYTDIAKSFAMRYDRRVAQRPNYLLFMAKKMELLKLSSNLSICLRKKKIRNRDDITAANLVNNDFLHGLVRHDDAFRVLAGVRNSCTHWHGEKQKVLAMVRQFGLPTLFLTLSAAETQWPELLQILKQVVDKRTVTAEEAVGLPYAEKSKLIQSDPVTCARYFNHRYQEQAKLWGLRDGPFQGKGVIHTYYRVEFQHRGSPHIHQLIWLKDALIYNSATGANEREVCNFIDSIISCESVVVGEEQQQLPNSLPYVQYQKHTHTRTCRKRETGKCRFGIPFYPMRETRILHPLPDDTDEPELNRLKGFLTQIKNALHHDENVFALTFSQFLERCQVNNETYLLAIRSELQRCKVFLRRSPSDIMINPYSPKILSTMRSNMDLQFVLDPYACASYIIDYINKSERGISNTIENIVKELRKGNSTLREAMKSINTAHYTTTEISAQEASYNILQMPLSHCSEQVIFIPTCPPDERVRILKPQEELRALDPASQDCFVHGLVEHYMKRPTDLENMPLADFAAWYQIYKRMPRGNPQRDAEQNEDLSNGDALDAVVNGPYVRLLDGSAYIRKRTRSKVIRYRMYNVSTDPEQFYRELVMLYHPWRNEQEELLDVDCERTFIAHREEILQTRQKYHYFPNTVLEDAVREAESHAQAREHDEQANAEAPTFDFDNYYLEESIMELTAAAEYERIPYAEHFQLPGQITARPNYNSRVRKTIVHTELRTKGLCDAHSGPFQTKQHTRLSFCNRWSRCWKKSSD